jgi:hypothetical protein
MISRCNLRIMFLTVALGVARNTAFASELISNGGFESGSTSWTLSGGCSVTSLGGFARSGSSYLWLGGAVNEVDAAYQIITIPSNATSATLSFYWNINSLEGNTTAFDSFSVTIRNTSNSVLASVVTLSNVNQTNPGNPNYHQQTFNLLPYAGQTIRIYFGSSNDGSKVTNFRVDDVSIQVTTPTCSAPTAITNDGNPVGSTTATLNGIVTPNGCNTTVYFEYGLTTAYGTSTSDQSFTGTNSQLVSANISGLSPNKTYHFRLRASNNGGANSGDDVTFNTPDGSPSPSPTPTPTATATATATPTAMPRASSTPTATATATAAGTTTPTATPGSTSTPSPSSGPVITSLTRQYPGIFLQGSSVSNNFQVGVAWNGQPGSVEFAVAGVTIATEQGNSAGASHTFNMGRDFTAAFAPIEMKITARNAAGQQSIPNSQNICVLPCPTWLASANAAGNLVRFAVSSGDVKFTLTADFPSPHLSSSGPIDIPANIPFIGGKLGLIETFARLQGIVSSNERTGLITLSGQTGFTAAGQTITGQVYGSGIISLECQNGLQLGSTSFGLSLSGNIHKEEGIADVIPQLKLLEQEPFIGSLVQWFNKKATLSGDIDPSLEFTARFKQDADGNLKFADSTGTIALSLNATLQVNSGNDRLSARAWVGGRGSSTVSVPGEPFVRNLNVTFEAGVALKLDYIISKVDWEKKVDYSCAWDPRTGVTCGRSESQTADGFFTVKPDYSRFGQYAEFSPFNRTDNSGGKTQKAPGGDVSAKSSGTTLVSNLFAGASPATIGLTNGGQLVLWVHANPALPITRATDIMWSLRDAEGNWTQPKPIAQDTRAEFSPVLASTTNGKIVAAWLRVKETNFPESISTADDVAKFYKNFEVVTADFDVTTRVWTETSAITDDSALDTDLRLSSDGVGNLLLSWLSNPGAEFMSTVTNPSTLKYSTRLGDRWTVPTALADALVGVGRHAAAVHGLEAFVVVPHTTDSNGALDVYRRTGGDWGAAKNFAASDVDNRLPSAAYSSDGLGHIVWVRDHDLVSATLDDGTPRRVRAGSTGVGFYDTRLVANADGNLALIYQQLSLEGPGSLFGCVYFSASNLWGEGQQLVNESRQTRDASAFFDGGGQLRIAYVSTEILRTTQTVDINGVKTIVENVPEEGQTDLKAATISGLSLLAPSTLANVSTRLNVGTNDNALIGGFIVTGNVPKRVLVRGVGPSLARFGLQGLLQDPVLELHDATHLVTSNDNWSDAPNRDEIANTSIAPSDPLESAILLTLSPGNYTAVLREMSDSSGVGVVEVYDLDQTGGGSRLANISTRGLVGTGDNVMIGGTIVTGSNPVNVLFRAIGPSLANFGVTNAIQDPILELHNGNGGTIAVDDNWRDSQEAVITATGIPPTDNRESAILANLPPGAYTAVVRGSGNSTGVALVEAYQLP